MGILTDIMNNSNQRLDDALDYILEYEKIIPFDNQIHTARAVAYFFAEKYEEAKVHIKKALMKRPNNYENNLYLAYILMAEDNYVEASKISLKSLMLANMCVDTGKLQTIISDIEATLNYCFSKLESNEEKKKIQFYANLAKTPGSFFPIIWSEQDKNWSVFCGEYLFFEESKEYNDYVAVLADSYYSGISFQQMEIFKAAKTYNAYVFCHVECWKAKTISKFEVESESIIPISATEQHQIIKFNNNGNKLQTPPSDVPSVFNYYRVNKNTTISSNENMLLGKPIPIGHKPEKKKLILNIFVDALSQSFLDETNYKDMPYTKKFFEKGTMFKNCFATAEWTHPSFASLFTGLYTTNHQVYNRSSMFKFPKETETVSEIFNKDYFTANITGSVGTTPYFGGFRGFDRTVFKSSAGTADKILIMDALEHMQGFKDTDQFILLSLFDIHRVEEDTDALQIHLGIPNQTNVKIETLLEKLKADEKSVKQSFNSASIEKYAVAIADTDAKLKILYDYILENYEEDEFIVSLFSDHGVPFLEKDKKLLKQSQINSVLMVRGSGIPSGYSDEYINHIDMIPAIAKFSNVDYDFSTYDCILPKTFGGVGREFSYSESIYPNQTYKAILQNDKYIYEFETIEVTEYDSGIDIQNYKTSLTDKNTNKKIKDNDIEEYFLNNVFEHIKHCIKC